MVYRNRAFLFSSNAVKPSVPVVKPSTPVVAVTHAAPGHTAPAANHGHVTNHAPATNHAANHAPATNHGHVPAVIHSNHGIPVYRT
jgi:hypothetical protein